jgi:hypothetical protein
MFATMNAKPTGETKDTTLQIRVTASFLEALDAWREAQEFELSRSEAIRHIVTTAIRKTTPKTKPKA